MLKLRPYDADERGAVTAYRDMDCVDNTGRFMANSDKDQYASYTTRDINRMNMYNNDIESVRVPYGWSITLYDQDNFYGRSTTLKGKWIDSYYQTMEC